MSPNNELERRDRDMILAPNEYALIRDETKGEINVFVGPNKTSLAGTDRPVVFDVKAKRFLGAELGSAIKTFYTAPEGFYVVLKNAAVGEKHPSSSGKLSTPDLSIGKKVNIPGPASFALWPGQMAKVVQGHNLRSNEYLLVRVYDEEAAKANITKAVVKTQDTDVSIPSPERLQELAGLKPSDANEKKAAQNVKESAAFLTESNLSMGKLFVIKGTEVSFYIPPTGIEVVPEKVNGEERYVREAVTLERLEYCLLLDQNGNKRYVHGPDVVFPRPTEKFVDAPIKSNPEKAKAKKFRAQELTPASGIHIRVIADYEDRGKKYKAGEELFITGKEQTIYFPREEHAIIKYGDQEIHYGLAIPSGEARYVLNRMTGEIKLVEGPQIFLPDPRTEVIAQRALDLKLCSLLYPGNQEALAINAVRLDLTDQDISVGGGAEVLLNGSIGASTYGASAAVVNEDTQRRVMIKAASKALPGDAFDRKNKFTAPRSIVLNTKFDGAVTTSIWTGYAMLLVRKTGERRVVQGPGTYMLEYDESPQVLTLSRGKPKTTDNCLQTVFLLTKANMVSDIVEVETKDFCKLNIKLNYRVNFEGNPESWFNVDNYVKFLCDHMRSRIRSAVQKRGIEEFYGNHTDILRDIILGESQKDGSARPGIKFAENGMHIYDVEILGAQMQNAEIEKMLVAAQRDVIQGTLTLATERRKLEYVRETENVKRAVAEVNAETRAAALELASKETGHRLALSLTELEARTMVEERQIADEAKLGELRAARNLDLEQANASLADVRLNSQKRSDEAALAKSKALQEIEVGKLRAQTEATVDKAKAVTPDLISALQGFSDKALLERVASSMAPLSILGGTSVVDTLRNLVAGTPLAEYLDSKKPATPAAKKLAKLREG